MLPECREDAHERRLKANAKASSDFWRTIRDETFKRYKLKDTGYAFSRTPGRVLRPIIEKINVPPCGDLKKLRITLRATSSRVGAAHGYLMDWSEDLYFRDGDADAVVKIPRDRLAECRRQGSDVNLFQSRQDLLSVKCPDGVYYYNDESGQLYHAMYMDGRCDRRCRHPSDGNRRRQLLAGGANMLTDERLARLREGRGVRRQRCRLHAAIMVSWPAQVLLHGAKGAEGFREDVCGTDEEQRRHHGGWRAVTG